MQQALELLVPSRQLRYPREKEHRNLIDSKVHLKGDMLVPRRVPLDLSVMNIGEHGESNLSIARLQNAARAHHF